MSRIEEEGWSDSQQQVIERQAEELRSLWYPRIQVAEEKQASRTANANYQHSIAQLAANRGFGSLRREDFCYITPFINRSAEMLALSDQRCHSNDPKTDTDAYMASLTEEEKRVVNEAAAGLLTRKQRQKRISRLKKLLRRLRVPMPNSFESLPDPDPPAELVPEAARPAIAAASRVSKEVCNGLAALQLYLQQNLSIKEAARRLEVSSRVVYRLRDQLRNQTLVEKLTQMQDHGRRARKYTEDTQTQLIEILRETRGALTILQMRERLIEVRGEEQTPSTMTIHRMLKKAGFTRKKTQYCPVERNSEINKRRRAIFYHQLILALAQGRRIYSVDETDVNSEGGFGYHYGPAGVVWDFNPGRARVPNTTCIFALSQYRVEQAVYLEGACDSALFMRFIHDLVLADDSFCDPDRKKRPIIVLDNAKKDTEALAGLEGHRDLLDTGIQPVL